MGRADRIRANAPAEAERFSCENASDDLLRFCELAIEVLGRS